MFATKLPQSVTEIPLAQEPQQVIYPYATARLVIMNSARISGAVALSLLAGIAIWGGTLHFLENGTSIVGESLSPADRNEQVLLDGLADGRILYFKIEDYRINRIIPGTSDPPHRVIIENWWQPDTGEQGELNVATVRDQDGGLLQYTQGIDGKYTTTFVSSGETMEMNIQWSSPAAGRRAERGDGARPRRRFIASIYARNRWKIYDHVRVPSGQRRDDGNEHPVELSGRVD